MSQIYVLHYDGVVTGSVELRKHNEHVVSKMYSRNHVNSGAKIILDCAQAAAHERLDMKSMNLSAFLMFTPLFLYVSFCDFINYLQ